MRRAYLAAPLFTPLEQEFNRRVTCILERAFKVFLPQRDGILIPGRAMDRKAFIECSKVAFQSDLAAIQESDVLVAILDGRTVDEGVCFELGYAFALGKECVALKSDPRVLLEQGINPMLEASVTRMFSSERGLLEWVDQLV